MLPKSPSNYQTERLGINAVAVTVARLGLIWRETPTGDVGIDGQIEYVDAAGHASGRLLSSRGEDTGQDNLIAIGTKTLFADPIANGAS